MTKYDYLVIGDGIAGVTAAETIREHNAGATIGILSDEPHLLYSRVLLPHYLKKRIRREQLFLRKADDFTEKKIDLRLGESVLAVDPGRHEVALGSKSLLGYGKLLIASGGRVRRWGRDEDKEFIYHLQTLDDADRLHAALADIKIPLVIGGSFISLELLEIFVLNDVPPTLLFRDAHFFGKLLDGGGADILRSNFERHGIRVQSGDGVKEIVARAGQRKVFTEALHEIPFDAIALGVGIERNMEFLQGSGIVMGEKGVRTDEFLKTNKEDVFAAGDVAEFYDVLSGRHRALGNWTNAFLQGKRVALNMLGQKESFRNVSAYSITNLGFQITALGDCEEGLETISRADGAKNQYERFFIKGGVTKGAVLINRFQDKPHLARLIEQEVNIESYRENLQDFEFDIRQIPA